MQNLDNTQNPISRRTDSANLCYRPDYNNCRVRALSHPHMLLPSRSAGVTYSATVKRMTVCLGDLFDHLFRTVTKFKLADGATLILAVFGPVGASNSGQPPQIATADWLVWCAIPDVRIWALAHALGTEMLYLTAVILKCERGRFARGSAGG